MVNDAQSSSSPWATQFLLLIFFAPIIGIPILIGAVFRATAGPSVNAGPSQEWAFFGVLIAVAFYFVRSMQKAKESQWLGISYYGAAEWTDSLRIRGEFVDYGELKQEDPSKPVQGFRLGRPIPIPKSKPGTHLYGIFFERGSIREIDVALPEHPEKCCKFVGHNGFGYVGWLPWTVKHISFASFLRTSWTQDPDGTVVPVGVLTDYDLLREQLRNELEPRVPTKEEMKVATNIRDNYYRDEVVKELEIERVTTRNLKKQLENKDKEFEERLGGFLDQWDKSGKKHRPKTEFAPSNRQKILYAGGIISLIVLGVLALMGKL